MQHGHLGRASAAAGGAPCARDRRDCAGGARRRAGNPEPSRRPDGDRGNRRRRSLRRARPRARRRHRVRPGRVPGSRPADRGRRARLRALRGGHALVCAAAEGGAGRHGHPRVHALPAAQVDLPARLRPLDEARLQRRRDRARGRGDAREEGLRELDRPRRRLPVPHHRRAGELPRDGEAVPPAAHPRGRARHAGGARARMSRADGRRPDALRPLELQVDFLEQPHGSVLLAQGKTKVLCTASIQDGVPRWLYGRGRGWLTAEYSLLPASTGDRTDREASRGKQGGRTVEIQRLIGRAVRAVTDFEALGERTLWLDCDVLQADGGTRCAAISGAYVAARRALDRFGLSKALSGAVAAVSVGIVDGEPILDLDYSEDSQAEVDMNVVMTGDGALVEVQATAERTPFTRARLDELLELAAGGIEEIAAAQAEAADAVRA